ncbi:hypothetical protein K504DRAFT_288250 [Pleomassaria siparia CBS 279.74]|uniref:Uncharacterized protein n=1 Tax=Pleomassaria siparia CBS 279.74 TaxID=1314801 RepID=A0A6G1K7J9_9PLEO|nr:hypothetical protein K504DRAFT_288250 [Pleomassaria siparia CBS 279.74]
MNVLVRRQPYLTIRTRRQNHSTRTFGKRHQSEQPVRELWPLRLDAWRLEAGCRMLGAGYWMLDAEMLRGLTICRANKPDISSRVCLTGRKGTKVMITPIALSSTCSGIKGPTLREVLSNSCRPGSGANGGRRDMYTRIIA